MNHKNIRAGMILNLYEWDYNKMINVEVLSEPYLSGKEFFVKVAPLHKWHDCIDCRVVDLFPFGCSSFVGKDFIWDKSVPTLGKPFKNKLGDWVIEIDSSKLTILDDYVKIVNEVGHVHQLCAIIPKADFKFVCKSGSVRYSMYLPVTDVSNTRKVTHKEIEEKFGCKIEIVGEGK